MATDRLAELTALRNSEIDRLRERNDRPTMAVLADLDKTRTERDEALAEVERLQKIVDSYEH